MRTKPNYYEILEILPDASAQEIKTAYSRAKAAYQKDSLATYSLFSEKSSEDLLREIEDAYGILSNPDKKKAYDKEMGALAPQKKTFLNTLSSIQSAPMDLSFHEDAASWMSPAVDSEPHTHSSFTGTGWMHLPISTEEKKPPSEISTAFNPENSPESNFLTLSMDSDSKSQTLDPTQFLENGIWTGKALQRVRLQLAMTLETLAETTKISRSYLTAIEEEQFSKLPAAVFLRGFVQQLAKALKLSPETVALDYMKRYSERIGK